MLLSFLIDIQFRLFFLEKCRRYHDSKQGVFLVNLSKATNTEGHDGVLNPHPDAISFKCLCFSRYKSLHKISQKWPVQGNTRCKTINRTMEVHTVLCSSHSQFDTPKQHACPHFGAGNSLSGWLKVLGKSRMAEITPNISDHWSQESSSKDQKIYQCSDVKYAKYRFLRHKHTGISLFANLSCPFYLVRPRSKLSKRCDLLQYLCNFFGSTGLLNCGTDFFNFPNNYGILGCFSIWTLLKTKGTVPFVRGEFHGLQGDVHSCP